MKNIFFKAAFILAFAFGISSVQAQQQKSTVVATNKAASKYESYLGNFSSKQAPFKIVLSDIKGDLVATPTGDMPPVILDLIGKDKFIVETEGLEFQFNEAKTEFTVSKRDESYLFTRD